MTCTGTHARLLAAQLDVGRLHRSPGEAVQKREAFRDRRAARVGLRCSGSVTALASTRSPLEPVSMRTPPMVWHAD